MRSTLPVVLVARSDLREVLVAARRLLKDSITRDLRYKVQPRVHCGACYTHLERDGKVKPHDTGCPVPGWERAIALLEPLVSA